MFKYAISIILLNAIRQYVGGEGGKEKIDFLFYNVKKSQNVISLLCVARTL